MKEVLFSQADVMDLFKATGETLTTGGLCFRLSWKWAACKAAGLPFKSDLEINAVKTARKHMAYRVETLALAPKTDFAKVEQKSAYIAKDREQHAHFINQWGASMTKQGTAKYPNSAFSGLVQLNLADYLRSKGVPNIGSLLYVFYWDDIDGNGKPTVFGHAVAFSGGSSPCFFDSNEAEYQFEEGDDPTDFVAEHIRSLYTSAEVFPSLYVIGTAKVV